MKILISWSSGKDAAVAGLLTTTNSAFDRGGDLFLEAVRQYGRPPTHARSLKR